MICVKYASDLEMVFMGAMDKRAMAQGQQANVCRQDHVKASCRWYRLDPLNLFRHTQRLGQAQQHGVTLCIATDNFEYGSLYFCHGFQQGGDALPGVQRTQKEQHFCRCGQLTGLGQAVCRRDFGQMGIISQG